VLRLPTTALLAQVLTRPLPYARQPAPLLDPDPDPGLFGPGSVTWRVMREPLLILGAGAALLMQAANPRVAQGAIDHSNYATDPYGRLDRTIEWVTVVCFGTSAEARRATRRINRLHRRVAGTIPAGNATRRAKAGQAYSAADRALLRWVHASFVHSMLVAHDRLIGGLSSTDRDRFVCEWDAVAALMGVSRRMLWRDAAALERYVENQISSGWAMPGPGSQLVAEAVLHPPVPSPLLRPAADLLAFTAAGLLPPALRRAYGIRWSPAHEASHRGLRISVWALRAALRGRLRTSPVYDRALARAEGRWPQQEAA
jgi:uncharacterized protein (DUF2236 family)